MSVKISATDAFIRVKWNSYEASADLSFEFDYDMFSN